MNLTPGRMAFALGAVAGVVAVLLEDLTPLTAPVLVPGAVLALIAIVAAVVRVPAKRQRL